MTQDREPKRANYYRADEKTEAGELVFYLSLYGSNGRLLETKHVPASEMQSELAALQQRGISVQRIA
jgi:hypothetical protein